MSEYPNIHRLAYMLTEAGITPEHLSEQLDTVTPEEMQMLESVFSTATGQPERG